jgi:hypothetical protein
MTASCWAVSCGSYSDYRIEAIFAAEPLARGFAERMNATKADPYAGEYEVEEFPFYSDSPEFYIEHMVFGHVDEAGRLTFSDDRTSLVHGPRTRSKRPRIAYDGLDRERGPQHVTVEGESVAECRKVIQDRVAEWKAHRAGVA